MTEIFSTLGTWNWLIFGFILMALELLAPGIFLFWLGLAALLVGLVSFAINPSWQTQLRSMQSAPEQHGFLRLHDRPAFAHLAAASPTPIRARSPPNATPAKPRKRRRREPAPAVSVMVS